jgi:hypothetical protein
MGGSTEDDRVMIWFLEKASGGDIFVIRASGSDSYNDYFYSDLGVEVNSVETIVFHSTSAANNTYVLQQIANAEAYLDGPSKPLLQNGLFALKQPLRLACQ